ncbi:RloB family protein [Undibacterium flavidum]|uniref:RloB domain-containing protein n=1 Tax=Undibacterium flavidum TaxID=2762297 RepID=A0ABR6YG49_9BURK|nr:RloB family protein [Undibacterium flavidum]MBC3875518.1 RloB domain-containing protein [Undibacterium flavidum]
MGSEDNFHKRKARSTSDLKRVKAFRKQNKRILIICEGSKTEFNYFRDLRTDLGIDPKQVNIPKNDGNTPDRILDHALALYDEDALSGDAYDKVYCVFDRDTHSTFDESVQRIESLKSGRKPKPFEAITSTPCFEFWLLLHFGYTDAAFHQAGKKSVGDNAVAALKKKPGFAAYDKGTQGIYKQLKPKLPDAIKHAQKLREESIKNRTMNPATNVNILVLDIQALSSSNK